MLSLGTVPASTTVYIPFTTFGKTNGESITCTGLAVTDIEIYKNGSTTQRSSDAGYALLDTDGIDFDGITGLHGFSIDLSDNTDAGFYAVGSWYWVVVSAITVDSQTVTFCAATFRIGPAEGIAGYPKTDVHAFAGTAATATGGRPEVNTTHWGGTAVASATVKADLETIKTQTVTCAAGVTVLASVGTAATSTAQTGDSYAIVNSGTHGNAALKTLIDAIDDYIDTEVAAIKAKTDNLPAAPAATGDIPTAAAIADAVWDEATAGHVAAGSTGLRLTRVPDVAAGANGGLPTVDANNYVAGIQGTKNQLDDLNDIAAAGVNAEVVDCLNTDTYAEPGQEAPPSTTTLVKKIGYLYKFLRNKKTQTATTWSLYADDATTVDQKATVSDDGTTATKGEVATGP